MLLSSLLVHHHSLGLKKRPHLISSRALAHYFTFLFLFTITLFITRSKAPEILGYATNISIESLLQETNKGRLKNGVEQVHINSVLSSAAEKKAEDMFKYNYWSHTSPSGVEPWDFILGENYDYIYAGENLARDFTTSKGVVEAWLDSPSHRDNLLNPKYVDMGLAVVDGKLDGTETTLVVQLFGTPRNQLAEITEASSVEGVIDSKESIATIDQVIEKPKVEVDFEQGVVKRQPKIMQLEVSQAEAIPSAIINVNRSTEQLVLYFAILLLILFTIDSIFVFINRYDKHLAHGEVHILYILFIIIGVLIIKAGGIL